MVALASVVAAITRTPYPWAATVLPTTPPEPVTMSLEIICPVMDTTEPVWLVAAILPPVMLPVAVTTPPVRILPASRFPVKLALLVESMPMILPAYMLPVPDSCPDPKNTLPPVMLPVVVKPPAVTVPVPEIAPPAPVVVIPAAVRLPTALTPEPVLTLPVVVIVPVTDTPVVENTAILDVAPMVTMALPFAAGKLILLVPLAMLFAVLVTVSPVRLAPLPNI